MSAGTWTPDPAGKNGEQYYFFFKTRPLRPLLKLCQFRAIGHRRKIARKGRKYAGFSGNRAGPGEIRAFYGVFRDRPGQKICRLYPPGPEAGIVPYPDFIFRRERSGPDQETVTVFLKTMPVSHLSGGK